MAREPDVQEWKEAVHYHNSMGCEGCGEDIDFSEIDDVNDAIAKWNKHVRSVHGD